MRESFNPKINQTDSEKSLEQGGWPTWLQVGAINLISKFLGTLSTTRDAEEYRRTLFPEYKTQDELLAYLKGRCCVDIGSGFTHKDPEALINRIAEMGDDDTLFFGVDPNVGSGGPRRGFFGKKADQLESELASRSDKTPAGQKFGVVAELPEIPLPQHSVDVFMSVAAVGLWMVDPEKMLALFKAMEYALSSDGQIRISYGHHSIFEQDNKLGRFIREHFVMEYDPTHGLMPYLIVFRRRDFSETSASSA